MKEHMSDTRTATLGGRAVEMRLAPYSTLTKTQKAVDEPDAHEKTTHMVVLAASAFWADTGEPVFSKWQEVDAWPLRDANEINALLGIMAEMNSPKTDKKAANGSALPSDSRPNDTSLTV